ncbi:uncharacterized protein [Arachis hypogaea]|uniref:uncharacterized protein isoform X2 n=1 Tax=Arachis hypogaea TaxID=3818 RepID=UPI003B21B737
MALGNASLGPSVPYSFPAASLCTQCFLQSPRLSLRASAALTEKARFVARRKESISVRQLERPLIEYMRLPASQYSVLDAERIERVNDNTFRCYVYGFKFFNFEVIPVLLVKVEEQPDGCCIKLLSCKLEGSPMVASQNDKFDEPSEKTRCVPKGSILFLSDLAQSLLPSYCPSQSCALNEERLKKKICTKSYYSVYSTFWNAFSIL